MQKVIFFTADAVATEAEKTQIEKLNTMAEAPYQVMTRNGKSNLNYGAGPEKADLVAGAVPDSYKDVPTIDPDNPPGPTLPATDAIVSNGATVVVKNSAGTVSKNGTATVAASKVSGVALAATEAIVSDAGAVVVHNSTGTAVAGSHTTTVAAGVVSNVKLAATVAPVVNGATVANVTGTGTTATITVANGVITGIALSSPAA